MTDHLQQDTKNNNYLTKYYLKNDQTPLNTVWLNTRNLRKTQRYMF